MTSQDHFSFSFPEDTDGLIDYNFVRNVFLGITTFKKYHKIWY